MAYSSAIMPPMDTPIRWKPLKPSLSTSALASSASMLRGVGPGGLVALADAAIVEAQHAEAGIDQRRDLEAPGQQIVGKAVDEDDGAPWPVSGPSIS